LVNQRYVGAELREDLLVYCRHIGGREALNFVERHLPTTALSL
jgi:hypothetical protein